MLTRLKLKQGEGELEKFNQKFGKRRNFLQVIASKVNIYEFDVEAFQRAFVELKALVDILLQERHE